MSRNTAADICTALFKSYPKVKTFYVTTDGQAFEGENNAYDHAKHLDPKNAEAVEKVTRKDKAAKEEQPAEEAATEETAATEEKPAEEVAKKPKTAAAAKGGKKTGTK